MKNGKRFVIADVFSEKRFGGNQLAVFTDGLGLDDATMQNIAREMNYSETTFLLPPESGGDYRVSATGDDRVRLDGGPWWRDGERVQVSAGTHVSEVIGSARLISWSDAPAFREQTERRPSNLFESVYDY